MKTILIPLPNFDADPSETAVSWRYLKSKGINVVFATPQGKPVTLDPIMLTGRKLGPFKRLLMADSNALNAYIGLSASEEFRNPISWDQAHTNFDGILLTGGHAKGVREYLESTILQSLVAEYFRSEKIVAAICHGVVLAARSRNSSGQSNLYGRKTTSLLKFQEMSAWLLTSAWLGSYYRTYPETVEDEVRRNLKSSDDFVSGPLAIKRDSSDDLSKGFALRDGNYISARWPGDAHRFSAEIADAMGVK